MITVEHTCYCMQHVSPSLCKSLLTDVPCHSVQAAERGVRGGGGVIHPDPQQSSPIRGSQNVTRCLQGLLGNFCLQVHLLCSCTNNGLQCSCATAVSVQLFEVGKIGNT